jgi:glyoxylase-like metal-dependent hydrolase (beta-lactamase superfamily II)
MDVVNVTADADGFTSNAFLTTGDRPTLVDAGAWEGVVDRIREHTDSLAAVVLTHQDSDHVDRLDAVLDAFDCPCYAFADHSRRTDALADGDTLQVGEETVEVVHTPGHTPDHVSLVGERRLFSGDVLVYNDGAFDDGSFGKTDRPQGDREVLVDSLERLRERVPASVEVLYAGHGDVFRGDVHAALDRALERAERREPKYPDE